MVKSLMIEFQGKSQSGLLDVENKYWVTYGTKAAPRRCPPPLDHASFLDLLQQLHYKSGSSPESAIQELKGYATEFLGLNQEMLQCDDEILQIDLVTEISELWPIPFEAVSDDRREPLLLNPERKIVLTRRRRGESTYPRSTWDPHPRILFAWANPSWAAEEQVPHVAHLEALQEALKPWSESLDDHPDAKPGLNAYLKVIDKASEEKIAQECAKAQEKGKPFGYIHILAHGKTIEDRRGHHRNCIGVCLESASKQPTSPESLCQAFHAGSALPSVVTLAVCGGADNTNPIVPSRSIAQELHCNGVPVVLASQLPLTFAGSTELTRSLYPGMLEGEDIRETLFRVRFQLSDKVKDSHDWLSLCTYVRLPEDYDEVRAKRRIATTLGRLKTAQNWTDYIVNQKDSKQIEILDQHMQTVAKRLEICIAALAEELEQDVVKSDQSLLLEALGLMGSARKRQAELSFHRNPENAEAIRAALIASRDWYRRANRRSLSNHWTGVQALSMQAVLDGSIDHRWWEGTIFAAEGEYEDNELNIETRIWACGSLAELHLLTGCADEEPEPALELALKYLQDIKRAVLEDETCDSFLLESTIRQFNRYINWWTKANGYFPNRESDLASEASWLLSELDVSLDDLMKDDSKK